MDRVTPTYRPVGYQRWHTLLFLHWPVPVEALRPLVPAGMTMPEMALRFILANPDVATVIPGMRKLRHVRANIAASDGAALPPELLERLRAHRWDRAPTAWSM